MAIWTRRRLTCRANGHFALCVAFANYLVAVSIIASFSPKESSRRRFPPIHLCFAPQKHVARLLLGQCGSSAVVHSVAAVHARFHAAESGHLVRDAADQRDGSVHARCRPPALPPAQGHELGRSAAQEHHDCQVGGASGAAYVTLRPKSQRCDPSGARMHVHDRPATFHAVSRDDRAVLPHPKPAVRGS
eukprot:scaffold464_cov244-Pinguiococcus_pyrenoidosus.AAC.5